MDDVSKSLYSLFLDVTYTVTSDTIEYRLEMLWVTPLRRSVSLKNKSVG